MRKSRFDDVQIVRILEAARTGVKADEVCRTHGISRGTLKRWRAKFGGLEVAEAARLRQLDEENRKLRKALADLSLDNRMLRDVVSRKW